MPDALAEILRSPLDDMPPRRRMPPGAALALSVVLGLIAGGGTGAIVGGDDTGGTTTTTTTMPPAVTADGLPSGYVPTGFGYGVRAEWITQRGDTLWAGISTAVPVDTIASTADPAGVSDLGYGRRSIGRWRLTTTDGRVFDAFREHFDDAAPGIVTVDFPAPGVAPDEVAALSLYPVVGSGEHRHAAALPVTDLPIDRTDLVVPATETVTQADGTTTVSDETTLVINWLAMDRRSGMVSWRVEGGDDLGMMLEVAITLEGDTPVPDLLAAESGGSAAFLQRELAPLTPARQGTIQLRRSAATAGTYAVTGLAFDWTVSWFRFADTAITVPVDAIRILGDDEPSS